MMFRYFSMAVAVLGQWVVASSIQASDPRGLLATGAGSSEALHYALTGEFLGEFTDGGHGPALPRQVGIGPDGLMYIADQSGHRIARFDARNGVYIDDFAMTTDPPYGVAFGANGDLYVGTDGGGIQRFDGATGTMLQEIAVGTRTFGIAFGPKGKLFALAFYDDMYVIWRFNPKGGFLGDFTPPLLSPSLSFVFGPDGDLYLGSEGTVHRYSGLDGEFIEIVVDPPGGTIVDVTFDRQGDLWALEAMPSVAYEYAGASDALRQSFDVKPESSHLFFFPPPLFEDGFESGDASAWSNIVP